MTRDDTHRGWLIGQNWIGQWEAMHPKLDPDNSKDDRALIAKTREVLTELIDEWIEEHA